MSDHLGLPSSLNKSGSSTRLNYEDGGHVNRRTQWIILAPEQGFLATSSVEFGMNSRIPPGKQTDFVLAVVDIVSSGPHYLDLHR